MYMIIDFNGRSYNNMCFREYDHAIEYFESEGLCCNEFQIVTDDY